MRMMKSRLLRNVVLTASLVLPSSRAQDNGATEALLQAAEQKELVEGDLRAAIRIYEQAANRKGAGRAVVANALLHIGSCYEKLGSAEARKAYERVAQQYADQTAAAAEAHKRLTALEGPARRSLSGEMLAHRLPFAPNAFYVLSDGKILVYVDSETGDLVASDLAGGHKRVLKRAGDGTNQSRIMLPRLSADGSKVAFTTMAGIVPTLAVVNTDGSGFHTLMTGNDGTLYRPLAWARDNTAALVYTSNHRLIKVRESDNFTQELDDTGSSWVLRAAYSPDGRWIAFSAVSAQETDLEIMSAEGKQKGKLVTHSGSNELIDWTPDGKAILFSSDRSGQPALYRLDVLQGRAQGDPVLIREGGTNLANLTPGGALIYSPQRAKSRVYVSRADFEKGSLSGLPQPVSDLYPTGQWLPAWSPNGKELAIGIQTGRLDSSARPSEILVIPPSPSQPRRIAAADPISDLTWAADGRSLFAVTTAPGKGAVIRRMALEGDAVTQVLSSPGDFSPDAIQIADEGRALLATMRSASPMKSVLVRYDLETGDRTELVTVPAFAVVSVSRDGRWIAASDISTALQGTWRSTLSIRAWDGGDWRQIVDLKGNLAIHLVEWTPDGRSIVYGVRRGDPGAASTSLFQVAASGGTPRKLGDLPGRVDRIAIHPDGTQLAFSSFGGKAELWMLENFLSQKAAAQ
jgi:Tol biopolymer transport system component